MIRIIILSTCVLIGACAVQSSTSQKTNGFEQVAKKKYQTGFEVKHNSSKSYVLVLKETDGNPYNHIDFFVFGVQENGVVYESSVDRGKVEWHSDMEIAILKIPGTIADGQSMEDYTTIYNLQSKKSRKKSEAEY